MKPTRPIALLLGLLIVLAACGSQSPPAQEATTTPPAATTSEPTVEATAETTPADATAETTPADATAETTPADTTFGENWQSVACDTFAVAPEIAERADCGYVTAPENRAAGSDKTIQLAVIRVRSSTDDPGSPMIKGTGGPGGAGLDIAASAAFLEDHAGILEDRDYIFFSQRGTQYARPELICSEYNAIDLESARNSWSDEERQTRKVEAIQACLDTYATEGIDLTAYNSNENAADIDTIRQTLGYDKLIYYGESYGTLLGQFLLRNHPEIVEAIMLDGIAPVTAEHWTDVTDFAASFQRVFDACAADEACHAAYPDPEGAMVTAMEALNANPVPFVLDTSLFDPQNGEQIPLQVDDTLAMNALFIYLYLPGGYRNIPAIVYQLSEGDYSALNGTIPTYFANEGSARGMHYAVVCSDDPVASLDQVNLEGVMETYAKLIIDDATGYISACSLMNLPQLPASSDELVTSDVPALLINGGLDPATPFTGGSVLQAGLPNSYNIIVPAGSHIQSHAPCILGIMDAFMNDPQTEPDTSCIDQTIPFGVPQQATVSSDDGSASLSMTLPPTFQANAGQWGNSEAAIVLSARAPGTPVDDAMKEMVPGLPPETFTIVDGPQVAGYATRAIQTEIESEGKRIGVDLIAFENEQGIYLIVTNVVNPDHIDTFRQSILPKLLETVQVSGA